MSQGPFRFYTSGSSTVNYTDDTNFAYLGGTLFVGPPDDWTQVVSGYSGTEPSPGQTQTYPSAWKISGTGGSGRILQIQLRRGPNGGRFVIVTLASGGGTLSQGGTYFVQPPTVPCFLEGATLLCLQNGAETYLPVETLRPGTLVVTRTEGPKKVVAIGHRTIDNPGTAERVEQRLYKLPLHTYPELKSDLFLTGGHSTLVPAITEEQRCNLMKHLGGLYATEGFYRLPAFLDERAEPWASRGTYTVWHFALENEHEGMNNGVYANGGLLVETCGMTYLTNHMTLVE